MPARRAANAVNKRDQMKRENGDYDIQKVQDRLLLNRRRIEVGLSPKPLNQTEEILKRMKEHHEDEYAYLQQQLKDVDVEWANLVSLTNKHGFELPKEDDTVPQYYKTSGSRPQTSSTDLSILTANLEVLKFRQRQEEQARKEQAHKEQARKAIRTASQKKQSKKGASRVSKSSNDADGEDGAAEDEESVGAGEQDAEEEADTTKLKAKSKRAKEKARHAEADSDEEEQCRRIIKRQKIKEEPRSDHESDNEAQKNLESEVENKKPTPPPPEEAAATTDPNIGQRQRVEIFSSHDFTPLWLLLHPDSRSRLLRTETLSDQENPGDTTELNDNINILIAQPWQASALKVNEGLLFSPTSACLLDWTMASDSKFKKAYKCLATPDHPKNGTFKRSLEAALVAIADDQNPDGTRAVFAILVARHSGPETIPTTSHAPLNEFLDGLRRVKQNVHLEHHQADGARVASTSARKQKTDPDKDSSSIIPRNLNAETAIQPVSKATHSARELSEGVKPPAFDSENENDDDYINQEVVEKMSAYLDSTDSEEEAELQRKADTKTKAPDTPNLAPQQINDTSSNRHDDPHTETPLTAGGPPEALPEPAHPAVEADNNVKYNDSPEDDSLELDFW
jgi:hypothetical protein